MKIPFSTSSMAIKYDETKNKTPDTKNRSKGNVGLVVPRAHFFGRQTSHASSAQPVIL
jgi:hypothetical protein